MSSDSENFEQLDQLAYEITRRIRDGERPQVEEYVRRYPDLAEDIRELFPVLADFELAIHDNPLRHVAVPPSRAPRITGYLLGRRLGRGGMGVVYEAEHQLLRRQVALKVLAGSLMHDNTARERFRREARAAGRLHHTNIVPIYEVGEEGDTLYYSMQLIDGYGLDRVIDDIRRIRISNNSPPPPEQNPAAGPRDRGKSISDVELARSLLRDELQADKATYRTYDNEVSSQQKPVLDETTTLHPSLPAAQDAPAGEVVLPVSLPVSMRNPPDSSSRSRSRDTRYYKALARLGMQVASGLSYAHARGVIHRDVKPSNILLDASGTAWVTDFGLARDGESELTATEDVIGTFRYLAPERFAGHCDERSDLYGLGLTLYELLALEPAFSEYDRAMLVEAIRTRLPRSLRQFDTRLPRDLETIVLKSIEKEPARRYASADELAADLRRFLADEPIRARRVRNSEKVLRWCRRNPALAIVSCLAIVGVLATVIILATSNRVIRDRNAALRVAVHDRDRAIAGQTTALGQRETALGAARDQQQRGSQRGAS